MATEFVRAIKWRAMARMIDGGPGGGAAGIKVRLPVRNTCASATTLKAQVTSDTSVWSTPRSATASTKPSLAERRG